ncbi:DUF2806 domain-containing protein [Candidatus Thioglobus sp.]|uniref:DUF2806 domain-containing protein n=1 Tax=Candidatus Thioglobus sp. TaxID=2026721 RepID=UPI003D147EAE
MVEIKDLIGLSKPLEKLIEVISTGVGAVSQPYLIKKTADAKAYEIRIISQAIEDSQSNLKNIEFNDGKISLSLEDKAQQRVQFKEQKRQLNIESITQKAADTLAADSEVSDEPVDEDWTSRFFNYAEDISNDETQELWGRILAGEVKKPKSYSLRALDVLRNLSTKEAEVFIKFGALAIRSSRMTFLLNPEDEKLLEEDCQLKFEEKLLLEELSLITVNDLAFSLPKTEDTSSVQLFILGKTAVIQNKIQEKPNQQLKVLFFTKIGQELLQLIDVEPKMEYIQLLATKLNRKNGAIQYTNSFKELSNNHIQYTELIDVPLTEDEKNQANAHA